MSISSRISSTIHDLVETSIRNVAEPIMYHKNQFDRIRIIGDGNCFFRRIALSLYNDENRHMEIRNEVVEESFRHLSSNPSIFDHIKFDHEIETIDEYLPKMKRCGEYVSQFEILRTQTLYSLNIKICTLRDVTTYQYCPYNTIQNSTNLANCTDVYVLYHCHAPDDEIITFDNESNHYDLLKKL